MEEKWTCKTRDGFTIYGVKNFTGKKSRAIFIVHGLTGHMYEYQHKRAADYFEQDYDVYRFNLYDGADGSRALVDCTIETHAADLNDVLSHFSAPYEKVFLIGHSYGGTTVIKANADRITAVSLWDPTYDLCIIQQSYKDAYIDHGDYYQVNWGVTYLIGKAMYEEAGRLDADACEKLARDFKSPIQVVLAGDGFYIGQPRSYDSFDLRNRRDLIDGTVHCFYEGKSCDDLLAKTAGWFASF